MVVLYSSRKLCPTCGKPMAAVPDDAIGDRPRYVYAACEGDPLPTCLQCSTRERCDIDRG